MFRNYLKTAFRNLLKEKMHAGINIIGLAIGMAVSILVILFIQYELSYDRWQVNSDQIYRLGVSEVWEGETSLSPLTPFPLGNSLKDDLPDILASTKFNVIDQDILLEWANNQFYVDKSVVVDSSFTNVFDLPFLYGNPRTALRQPDQMLISSKLSKRIFGEEDPVGKTLKYQARKEYTIAGVLKEPAGPSHFNFDAFLLSSKQDFRTTEWISMFNYYTYVKCHPLAEQTAIEKKINQNTQSYFRKALVDNGETNLQSEDALSTLATRVFLQPIKDIHLHSKMEYEINPGGSTRYLYIYGSIAFIILLIACINFMNLATARSIRRAKEVGIRKVVGATRWQASVQFLIESFLQSSIALAIGVIFAELMLPFFGNILQIDLSLSGQSALIMATLFIGLILFTGFLAGSYPAFFLSAFTPSKVLNGDYSKSKEGVFIRKGMVILQFFACTSMMLYLFTVSKQIEYMHNKQLGFEGEQVMVIPLRNWDLMKNFQPVKDQLKAIPNVLSVSQAMQMPGEALGGNSYEIGKYSGALLSFTHCDQDYLKTLDIQLQDGRFFREEDFRDSIDQFIVNEKFLRQFNIPNLNEYLELEVANGQKGRIVGVVKDFHFAGLHEPIQPVVFHEPSGYDNRIALKIRPENIQRTIQDIKNVWQKFEPNFPLQFSFLKQDFGKLVAQQDQFSQTLTYLTLLILLTAILGLFGLATYMAEQRSKEIGIRKVFGASVSSLLYLLIKDFTKLVLIAGLLALPVGYYFSQQWLQDFAYRVKTGPAPYFIALATILIITILTVSYQAYRTSMANPIHAIKNEQ